jgi:hypothetical protein
VTTEWRLIITAEAEVIPGSPPEADPEPESEEDE